MRRGEQLIGRLQLGRSGVTRPPGKPRLFEFQTERIVLVFRAQTRGFQRLSR
jgi:hypothetical protein